MSTARFDLYVKQAGDGGVKGSCPFSNKAFMVMLLKVPESQIKVHAIDLQNKPEAFLKINPGGTCPFLVDHEAATEDKKYISDSADILVYIDQLFPTPDIQCGVQSTAADCTAALFPKFAAYMKNQDMTTSKQKRESFEAEVQKLEDYLQSEKAKHKFLLSDELSEVDCKILPMLLQMKIAGKHFKGFDIDKYAAISSYIKNAEEEEVWKKTHAIDQDLRDGWSLHGCVKEC